MCVRPRAVCVCVCLAFPSSGSRQASCDTAAVAWTEPRAASGAPRSLGGSGLWPNWDMPGVPQFLMGCSKARREHGCGCTLSHPSVGRGQHLHVGNFAGLCLDLYDFAAWIFSLWPFCKLEAGKWLRYVFLFFFTGMAFLKFPFFSLFHFCPFLFFFFNESRKTISVEY